MNTPSFNVRQIFRTPRYSRTNTNVRKLQPIDWATWMWFPGCDTRTLPDSKPRSFCFKNTFESDGSTLRFDITADERFVLFLDGKIIARGPDRAATIENWLYHSYEVTNLTPGSHTFEAICWTHGSKAPLEQLSFRGGMIFKAEAPYEAALDSGAPTIDYPCPWRVGELTHTQLCLNNRACWGCGHSVDSTGTGLVYERPTEWVKPIFAHTHAGSDKSVIYGGRTDGWMLFPTQLKNQTENHIIPGKVVLAFNRYSKKGEPYPAVSDAPEYEAAFNALLHEGQPLTLPPQTELTVLWDLEKYQAGYPYLKTQQGKGACIAWNWAEGLYNEKGAKLNRNEFAGRHITEEFDYFRPDGRANAEFSTQWWRCGRWCELKFKTAEEPLTLSELALDESRYPLERESTFVCDDASFQPIQEICTRVMQQCAHETLFDGPYYEQQMYPGDTRVQLLTLSALAQDDRMIRRAIEIFDFGQRDDGMVPMNWPTRGLQESATYTQCWLLMFRDYVRYHDNQDWLKARLPSVRKAISAFEMFENEEGLLQNLPGWNFMDWVPRWTRNQSGTAPSSFPNDPPSALINLFYLLNLQGCAEVERALGHELMAQAFESKIPNLKARIYAHFWDEKRGMLADNFAHDEFSEHAQSLAALTGVLEGEQAQKAFQNALEDPDPDFSRCTVYFSYYLFEACFKLNRSDVFLKKLDLWRGYLAAGLSTTMECPEENGLISRSDCHAWGSHPLYWMQAGLAGIQPAAAFFQKVRIAPQPGSLKWIQCAAPHPKGFIKLNVAFNGSSAEGSVELPQGITGEFIFAGQSIPLVGGLNTLKL